jgi:hypothetical protein
MDTVHWIIAALLAYWVGVLVQTEWYERPDATAFTCHLCVAVGLVAAVAIAIHEAVTR